MSEAVVKIAGIIDENLAITTTIPKHELAKGVADALAGSGITEADRSEFKAVYEDKKLGETFGIGFDLFYQNCFSPSLKAYNEKVLIESFTPDVEAWYDGASDLKQKAADGKLTPKALLDYCSRAAKVLGGFESKVGGGGLGEREGSSQNKSWEDYVKRVSETPPFMDTSWTIDDTPLRIYLRCLTTIAAPTGHGKTSYMLSLLNDLAKRYPDKKHYFFSGEEPNPDIDTKLISILTGVRLSADNFETIVNYSQGLPTALDSPSLDPASRSSLVAALDNGIAQYKKAIESGLINIIYINDDSMDELMYWVNKAAEEKDCGVIMVDHLQQFQINGQDEIKGRVAAVVRFLLNAAKKDGVAIVAASQFNREVKKPSLLMSENSNGAAEIEQKSACQIAIFNGANRTAYSKAELDELGMCEKSMYVKFTKNRRGRNQIHSIFNFDGNTGIVGTEKIDPRADEIDLFGEDTGKGGGKVIKFKEKEEIEI